VKIFCWPPEKQNFHQLELYCYHIATFVLQFLLLFLTILTTYFIYLNYLPFLCGFLKLITHIIFPPCIDSGLLSSYAHFTTRSTFLSFFVLLYKSLLFYYLLCLSYRHLHFSNVTYDFSAYIWIWCFLFIQQKSYVFPAVNV
jgi:hypothetical protein